MFTVVGDLESMQLYKELMARNQLTVRVWMPFTVFPSTSLARIEQEASAMQQNSDVSV